MYYLYVLVGVHVQVSYTCMHSATHPWLDISGRWWLDDVIQECLPQTPNKGWGWQLDVSLPFLF